MSRFEDYKPDVNGRCQCIDCRTRRGESVVVGKYEDIGLGASNSVTGGQDFPDNRYEQSGLIEEFPLGDNPSTQGTSEAEQDRNEAIQKIVTDPEAWDRAYDESDGVRRIDRGGPPAFITNTERPGDAPGSRDRGGYDQEPRDAISRAADERLAVTRPGGVTLLDRPEAYVQALASLNPKDVVGATKAPLRDVPASLLAFVAPVFALGARKYGRLNWRTQPIREVAYIEAAERHLLALKDGQDIDPESGVSHWAHLAATAGIVLDARSVGTLIPDDRTPGVTAELLATLAKK